MKSIIMEKQAATEAAAKQVKELIDRKPNAVLAMAGGRTTMGLYRKLAEMNRKGEINFEDVSIFLAADFETAPAGKYIKDPFIADFIDRIAINDMNVYYINSMNWNIYDEVIEKKGGLDLVILGLGANCHIGFNEPATPFQSLSHRQRITDATKRQYADMFGGEDKVPAYGYTIGIKTIYEARSHMLLAFGEEKAEPVFNMFYGRNDSRYPAAFLQVPPEVNVYMDEAAAAKL